MRRSLTRIRTSHVGRLPPPKGWADMPARLAGAEITDPVVIAAKVTPAIAETVKKQIEAGIDCIGDGEFWTARNLAHYAAHFTGVEARPVAPDEPPTTRHSTRERDEFPDFYGDCDRAGSLFLVPGETPMPPMTERVVARNPLKSKGPDAINRTSSSYRASSPTVFHLRSATRRRRSTAAVSRMSPSVTMSWRSIGCSPSATASNGWNWRSPGRWVPSRPMNGQCASGIWSSARCLSRVRPRPRPTTLFSFGRMKML